jgi:hypothetical protein
MSMLSKQDLDVAVKVLQDKVDFVMRAFNVAQPSALVGVPPTVKSLLQVYYEVKAGVPLQTSVDTPVENDVAGELKREVNDERVGEDSRGSSNA